MSQKFIKKKQTSPKSLGYGKFYAKAVYNQKHIVFPCIMLTPSEP